MLWYLSCPIKPVGQETYRDTKDAGLRWYRFLLLQGLDVVAPYWGLLEALNDTKPQERKLGMYIDTLVHKRCDGLVIVGDARRVQQSSGMQADIALAHSLDQPVLDLTSMTENQAAGIIPRLVTARNEEHAHYKSIA